MRTVYPNLLQPGDTVVILAPSRSLAIVAEESKRIAESRFRELGLRLVIGRHAREVDDFLSSSISSRIDDLHSAFFDKRIKAIMTAIGGSSTNQLLDYLDWDLIRKNPKIFCGFSDITILGNAIFAKTGLVTYSGPHFSSFGQKLYFDYTLQYFKWCLMSKNPYEVKPAEKWSDDKWYKNQQERHLFESKEYLVINPGDARGTIIGGNLCSFVRLHGTIYMPSLRNSVVFIEDDDEANPATFDRDLQSLIQQPGFSDVKALLIGRFQTASNMSLETLAKIVNTKRPLKSLPIIGNIDFGHTDPKITFPIGGLCEISASKRAVKITIAKH